MSNIKQVSAWKKVGKNGKEYLSLAIEMNDGTKEKAIIFSNTKTKDTQPDYKTSSLKNDQDASVKPDKGGIPF